MKAWRVWPRGYQPEDGFIVHEATAGKAKYSGYLILGDPLPDLRLIDMRARRAPEHDMAEEASA